jgi:hypothetical protein
VVEVGHRLLSVAPFPPATLRRGGRSPAGRRLKITREGAASRRP